MLRRGVGVRAQTSFSPPSPFIRPTPFFLATTSYFIQRENHNWWDCCLCGERNNFCEAGHVAEKWVKILLQKSIVWKGEKNYHSLPIACPCWKLQVQTDFLLPQKEKASLLKHHTHSILLTPSWFVCGGWVTAPLTDFLHSCSFCSRISDFC